MSAAKENISELQSEHRHQLHHLSNENLDLGRQLKSTKKELAQYKLEDSKKLEEQTEELRGLSNFLGSSAVAKCAPMESKSKRVPTVLSGSKRIPLGTSSMHSSETPMTKEVSTDKENLRNKKQKILAVSIQSPCRSAKKKNTNPFSSAKKTAQRTRASRKGDTPTKQSQYMLGDSEPTADVTGECNQS